MVLINVLHELSLRTCGTSDDDGTRGLQFTRNALHEVLVDPDMAAASGVCLVMQMRVTTRAAHHRAHRLLVVEIDDLGNLVIDPDEKMEMLVHAFVSCAAAGRAPQSFGASRGPLMYTHMYA